MTSEEIDAIVDRVFPCSNRCAEALEAGEHWPDCDAEHRDQARRVAIEVLKLVARRVTVDLALVRPEKGAGQ